MGIQSSARFDPMISSCLTAFTGFAAQKTIRQVASLTLDNGMGAVIHLRLWICLHWHASTRSCSMGFKVRTMMRPTGRAPLIASAGLRAAVPLQRIGVLHVLFLWDLSQLLTGITVIEFLLTMT